MISYVVMREISEEYEGIMSFAPIAVYLTKEKADDHARNAQEYVNRKYQQAMPNDINPGDNSWDLTLSAWVVRGTGVSYDVHAVEIYD